MTKQYKMGFWNGQNENARRTAGKQGPRGRPGIGFKLASDGNYDLENKKLTNVSDATANNEAVTKSQLDQKPDLTSVLLLNGQNHMTGDLDLRGNKLILPGEINMNRKLIKNLDVDENDDLSAVNMVTLKKFSSTSGDIDLQEKFNVKNSKQQNFSYLSANYDNLVSFSDVKNIFLSRKETFPMEAGLDMGNHQIYNVKDPTVDDQGANMRFVNTRFSQFAANPTLGETNLSGEKITNLGEPRNDDDASTKKYVDDVDKFLRNQISQEVVLIQNYLDKMGQNRVRNMASPFNPTDAANKDYVDKSFITPSGPMKNVLQYVMDNVNETSSEFGVTVLGIVDFPQTPHVINKKAIKFQMGLQSNNNAKYYSRIGLNMYSLPTGRYTFVVEFFPPTRRKVEVNCLSTTINVDRQVIGRLGDAWKNVTWITKNVTTPNEYLMVDLKCEVDQNSSDNVGWLIVWGVAGYHNNVPSAVYDRPYLVENGKVVMETDLDLNGKRLLNYPKSKAVIFGQYKKATDSESETFRINNETGHHVFGFDFTVKKITLHFTIRDGPIVPVNTSVMIKASSKTQSASGEDIGNNAISYSFDFAVAANEEFELSLRNRGGIARANVTILVEI